MKKVFSLLAMIGISSALAGCVVHHHQEPRWYKNGVSEDEVKSFHAQCVYKVGMNKVDAPKESTLIEACMIGDGFRWGVPPQAKELNVSPEAYDSAEPKKVEGAKSKKNVKKSSKAK